jgi:histone H3/H4
MPQPPPLTSTVLPFTREARAIAQNDRQAVMEARQRFNRAQISALQAHLDSLVESVEIEESARLTSHAMQKAVEVDDMARYISAGRSPAVEMTLREMQAAHNAGEVARILKRGYGL